MHDTCPFHEHAQATHGRGHLVCSRGRSLRRLIALLLPAVATAAALADVRGMLAPRLSQAGDWIAVSYQGAIAKVPRSGGPLTILTRGEGWDSDPAWSPDGTRIAYVSGPLGGGAAGDVKLMVYWQGGDRGAHSNPIYIEVQGRPAERRASAQYFLEWIDRLEQLLVARDRMDGDRVHVLAHLEQAREVYREMLR